MSNILKRIKKAYSLQTDAEVADFLGIKPSTLSMQKNRGRLNLQRIIKRCSDLNKNWLLDGKGKMRTEDQHPREAYISVYSSLEIENQVPNLQKSIKAGTLYADITDELRQFSSSDHVIGYVVSGKLMEPTLSKNDIAIINLEGTPEQEGIYLISSDHKLFFSHVEKQMGSYVLKNTTEQSSQNYNENGFETIGKLVWILRRVSE